MSLSGAALVGLLSSAAAGPAAPPAGAWEGVLEYPRRPVVLSVDFAKGEARSDATGSAALAVEEIRSEAGRIRFRMALGDDVLSFDAEEGASEMRGSFHQGERQLPFWLRRLPQLAPPGGRVEAWRQDLDAMLERYVLYDRSFSDANRTLFVDRLRELKDSLAQRTDAEVMVELARAVALAGNAHTRLYLVRNRTEVRRLPIRVWWFRDRLHVVRATAAHSDLLGCRVSRIAGAEAAAAAARVRGIKAGNDSWQRYMSSYLLTSPEILAGAGLLRDAEAVPLSLDCGGRTKEVRLAPLPLLRKTTPTEAWRDLAPAHDAPDGFAATALRPESAPLYLQRPGEHYWFERLPGLRAIYFQYNRSQEMAGGVSMGELTDRLEQAVAAQPLDAFVVDVRFNTGGDLGVGAPLVKRLAEKLQGVAVYVLTGRSTFSAGITHAVQWKQAARARLVGEAPGDELDMWAEGGNLVLPNSRLTAHYSNAFHAYSKRAYPAFEPYFLDLDVDSVAPDVPVEPSWEDYASGKDPLLDAVVEEISARGKPGIR